MGVDFLKAKCAPFAKSWDSARVEAAQNRVADSHAGLSAVARTFGLSKLRQGDNVLVRSDGEALCILADLSRVAVFVDPSPKLVNAIREVGGYARGTVQAAYPSLDLIRVDIQ